ncbi:ABC transporter ATP-binding protein [Candidatus Woesearchaeota archaeon]|nr:ABC transporter ATP-binding protein [Candidatus Woesearchaeota archaeon]
MKRPLLKISNLETGYDNLKVLHGIDMSVQEGALIAIIGPNGSGKSTAVKSVFGLTTHFKGKIRFQNKDLSKYKTHEIVRQGVAYVPQGRLVFDSLSVEENLDIGGYNLETETKKERKQRIFKLFPILKEKRKHQAGFLSGGQQQMLSIGRALMQEPKLLLLDEPSLGLDPKTQQLIFKTIKDINKAGTTVMMVEQNARQALKICSKAYIIEQGRIAAVGGPSLAKQKKVKELYLGG